MKCCRLLAAHLMCIVCVARGDVRFVQESSGMWWGGTERRAEVHGDGGRTSKSASPVAQCGKDKKGKWRSKGTKIGKCVKKQAKCATKKKIWKKCRETCCGVACTVAWCS